MYFVSVDCQFRLSECPVIGIGRSICGEGDLFKINTSTPEPQVLLCRMYYIHPIPGRTI